MYYINLDFNGVIRVSRYKYEYLYMIEGVYKITIERNHITDEKESFGIISNTGMNTFLEFKKDARFNFTRIGFKLRSVY